MSGGSQPAGNTTTTTAPPAYMLPYISTALGQANSLLGYQPQYYPGNTVAGFSAPQQDAMQGIQGMAGGTPYSNAADNFDTRILGGDFAPGSPQGNLAAMGAGGASNPYLDAMFKQAAGATQGQLASEFAGAGRNVNASEPLRSEQLNNLATDLYGGAYAQDRSDALAANQSLANQQTEALGMSPSLNAVQQGNLAAEMGVGQQVQNLAQRQIDANQALYNYYQQLPLQTLQGYEGMLGGVQSGSAQSSPYFTNPATNTADMANALSSLAKLYETI